MSITVVGSVALDTITTPFGSLTDGLGGSASHFSVSASFFTNVNMVGVVGKDFPAEHVAFFRSHHIDTTGLEFADGKTFRWEGSYDFDLNNAKTLATHLGVFETFQPKLPESYLRAPILFVANIHPALQQNVIRQMSGAELVGLDTMNLWINTQRDSVITTMKLVNLVTINESEARLLTQTPNLVKAAKIIQGWGPKIVVIKRGEYGAVLFYHDQVFNAPGLPLEEIYDPTGAGDSFAGGMMGYLAQQGRTDFETLKTAVICGSVMASYNVEKFSCDRLRDLTVSDIKKRFHDFETLAHFKTLGFVA